MGFKGFSASYVAVDPFEEFDERERVSESFEATPFPGSLKNIYQKNLDSDEEDEDGDNYNSNKISERNKSHRKYNPNEISSSEAID